MKRTSRVRQTRQRGGFTLVEVLLVLVIIVVIASLGITNYRKSHERALKNAARAQCRQLATLLDQYQMDVRQYPAGLDALIAPPADLADQSRWGGPYLEKPEVPKDPWEQQYQYVIEDDGGGGQRVRVFSCGPDLQPNSPDDISNLDP